jgi:hypothetical protein
LRVHKKAEARFRWEDDDERKQYFLLKKPVFIVFVVFSVLGLIALIIGVCLICRVHGRGLRNDSYSKRFKSLRRKPNSSNAQPQPLTEMQMYSAGSVGYTWSLRPGLGATKTRE